MAMRVVVLVRRRMPTALSFMYPTHRTCCCQALLQCKTQDVAVNNNIVHAFVKRAQAMIKPAQPILIIHERCARIMSVLSTIISCW